MNRNPHSTLRIAETFESLQGEGQRLGAPSLFIRVSGCNLRCGWCDTPYASWEPEGKVMDVAEVTEIVKKSSVRDVVVTGGEPMLFEGVEGLTSAIRALGRFITIETAGTVFREVECDLMSISPKLANSIPVGTPHEVRHRLIMEDRSDLKKLVKRYPSQLKFVMASSGAEAGKSYGQGPASAKGQENFLPETGLQGDSQERECSAGISEMSKEPESFAAELAEIDAILLELGNYPSDQVFLMPEGRDAEVLWARARKLVPICLARGFRLAPRIQIDLFGDTRGT